MDPTTLSTILISAFIVADLHVGPNYLGIILCPDISISIERSFYTLMLAIQRPKSIDQMLYVKSKMR